MSSEDKFVPFEYDPLIDAIGHFNIQREDVRGLLEKMDIREIIRYLNHEGYRVPFNEND